ncbi:DUF2834 domain-containing protein [Lyngbya confervoides]|uniref:DUF2834 domain-containing protein n=1 Tax=Lyngbya confervoides BDU141951 TaxID=1574623 RepID=A0ABD4T6Q2_9CYAN|nr:DUF2834 domain-containing protein [Lyngbya confervoides]MCM1984150.1 DUF2834 domain-containing protein [Lyngbya confervoides BDU141951]
MQPKAIFLAFWLFFLVYAFVLAPSMQPDTLALIQALATGHWDRVNPWILCLFNAMGLWPLVYGALMIVDGRGQKIPAWPFVVASFGVGAFAILPYLGIRQSNPSFSGEVRGPLRFWESRWLGGTLLLGMILLLGIAVTTGDWPGFVARFESDRFIHVMGLDFCLLSLCSPVLITEDLARRTTAQSALFWLAFLPGLGPLLYLCWRPPLPTSGLEEKAP